jgi:hypothetical protein
MKTYHGRRLHDGGTVGGAEVWTEVEGQRTPLDPRLDLWNHSPTGLNWGYGGSGPAQLALAILADFLNDDALAVRYHQRFKWTVIAPLDPNDGWVLTEQQIADALLALRTAEDAEYEERLTVCSLCDQPATKRIDHLPYCVECLAEE